MLNILLIPLLVVAIVLAISLVVIAVTKSRNHSSDQKLNERYIYRKEPHADQVTKYPNRLSDNEVTKG